jgi:site-specific DNA recombinase
MQMMNQVALYVRVSSEEQVGGYSLDAQEAALREDIKKRGKFVYRVYREEGISGIKEDRKELNQLLLDARRNCFGEVMVWTVSRISRKLSYFLQIIDELRNLGIVFRSLTEKFNAEMPIGQFAMTMMGAVAQMQRESWMESSRIGMERRAKSGRYNGELMLGYQRVADEDDLRDGSKLIIIAKEAMVIQRIFSMYANDMGYKAIVNQLNEEKETGKAGKSFSINGIKTILANPIYIGKVRLGDQIEPGIHEAIVSPELWLQVQERLKNKSKKVRKTIDYEYLLSGILRCPICGGGMLPMHAKSRRRDGTFRINYYYACGAYLNKGKTACCANSVRAIEAEGKVLQWLGEILSNPFWINKVIKEVKQKQNALGIPQEAEWKEINSSLTIIAEKQKQILTDYENESLSREIFLSEAQRLKLERQQLIGKREVIRNVENGVKWASEEIKAAFFQIRTKLSTASAIKKRELIRALVAKVNVNQNREVAELELNVPMSLLDDNQEMLMVLPLKKAK